MAEIARRHQVSQAAVSTALEALRRGGGTMAQFSHGDFGGMAQWASGGMSMVGDMFNSSMKAKLDGVLGDLARLLQTGDLDNGARQTSKGGNAGTRDIGGAWWPGEFGQPSTAGRQNDVRYAFFRDAKRLVVEDRGKRTIYDTADHLISGVSQQQGVNQTLTFSSQNGLLQTGDLKVVL